MTSTTSPVSASGTFDLGGTAVHRLGFGAMRIVGRGVWGPPADRETALAVLRRAVELGVDFIDTADSYGPGHSEELIREALHPYDGVTVATKAGFLRTGPNAWHECGRPEYLRQQCELSLHRLGVEQIDLFQLHRVDRAVPADDQFGTLRELQDEGKVRLLGLSAVTVDDIRAASAHFEVATVQNQYNLVDRTYAAEVEYCATEGIGFIPYFPLAAGNLAAKGNPVQHIADRVGATPSQVVLAWLLQRSPVMLPIPGTGSLEHLAENCDAAGVTLDAEAVAALDALA